MPASESRLKAPMTSNLQLNMQGGTCTITQFRLLHNQASLLKSWHFVTLFIAPDVLHQYTFSLFSEGKYDRISKGFTYRIDILFYFVQNYWIFNHYQSRLWMMQDWKHCTSLPISIQSRHRYFTHCTTQTVMYSLVPQLDLVKLLLQKWLSLGYSENILKLRLVLLHNLFKHFYGQCIVKSASRFGIINYLKWGCHDV